MRTQRLDDAGNYPSGTFRIHGPGKPRPDQEFPAPQLLFISIQLSSDTEREKSKGKEAEDKSKGKLESDEKVKDKDQAKGNKMKKAKKGALKSAEEGAPPVTLNIDDINQDLDSDEYSSVDSDIPPVYPIQNP
ncbi:hypothetical protein SEVIR_9G556101v4 [Setaria viridis]|uniref:uncharacterized protein n=1 Tax=Setaria viridis TaxID=4556 RepID=UPI001493956F|nr:uncharacterized protein LOC117835823 [Setaria viridis]